MASLEDLVGESRRGAKRCAFYFALRNLIEQGEVETARSFDTWSRTQVGEPLPSGQVISASAVSQAWKRVGALVGAQVCGGHRSSLARTGRGSGCSCTPELIDSLFEGAGE